MRKIYYVLFILCLPFMVNAQWTRLTAQYPGTLLLNDVYVHDNGQKITAVGYTFDSFQNYIFQSMDAGAHWDTMQTLPAGYLFLTAGFKDEDTGYIGGFGANSIFMRTVNGGASWDFAGYDTVNTGVSDMQFIDSLHAFAGGYGTTQFFSGHCYYTRDGGANWQDQNDTTQPSPLDSLGLDYIYFLDVQTGYGLSNFAGHRYLMKTMDSGKHWDIVYTHTTIMDDMYFWNVSNGIMTDVLGHIYKTHDGGNNWTQVTSPVSTELVSVRFMDANTGYAVGVQGKILKSTDGGDTWALETSPVTDDLFRVKCFGGKAYATGNGGTVLVSEPVTSVRQLPIVYQLNVYPNPATNVLNISVTRGFAFKEMRVTLSDLGGRVVARGSAVNGLVRLDTKNMAAGTYGVNVDADGASYQQKITIIK